MENLTEQSARELLATIRAGQPAPWLMERFSPKAVKSVCYLMAEFKRRERLLKTIVGDPGAGKTTFKNLLIRNVEELELPLVVPVEHTWVAQTTFNTNRFLAEILFSQQMFQTIPEALANLLVKDFIELELSFLSDRYAPVYKCFFQAGRGEVSDQDYAEFRVQFFRWFLDDRLTEFTAIVSKILGSFTRVPHAPTKQGGLLSFAQLQLRLLNRVGVYPIWFIDELESMVSLFNSSHGRDNATATLREFIDLIMGHEGTGALLLFSTRDCDRVFATYPALFDRVMGSETYSLPNPRWYVDEFSAWDGLMVLDVLKDAYKVLAKAGDMVALDVLGNLHLIRGELQDSLVDLLQDRHVPARKRLKTVVMEVFDVLAREDAEDMLNGFLPPKASAEIEKPEIPEPEQARPVDDEPSLFAREPQREAPEASPERRRPYVSGLRRTLPNKFLTRGAGDRRQPSEPTLRSMDDLEVSLQGGSDLFPELRSKDMPPELVKSLTGELMEFTAPTVPGHVTSAREVEDKLLDRATERRYFGSAGSLLAQWRSVSPADIDANVLKTVANLILPSSMATKLLLTLKADAHRNLCNMRTKKAFERILSGKWMYRRAKPTDAYPHIVHINPCQTLFSMRSFYYQMCFQNSYVPSRIEADEFILGCAKEYFGVSPEVSRKGIIFEFPPTARFFSRLISPHKFLANAEVYSGPNSALRCIDSSFTGKDVLDEFDDLAAQNG